MTAPAAIPVAHLHDVSHLYGAAPVLRHVSLTVPEAGCTLLLGENGAGKSTLLRVLAGLLRPRFGTVHLPPAAHIGYMAHAPMLYDELTAEENLHYFAALHMPSPCLTPSRALASVGLDAGNRNPLQAYSQGMRQRVSLARVLLAQPRLLLLDEPFSNMDAASAAAMLTLLHAERARGCAIVLTTHQHQLAAPLANRTLRLVQGHLHEEPAA